MTTGTLVDRSINNDAPALESIVHPGTIVAGFDWDGERIGIWLSWDGYIVGAVRCEIPTGGNPVPTIIESWPLPEGSLAR